MKKEILFRVDVTALITEDATTTMKNTLSIIKKAEDLYSRMTNSGRFSNFSNLKSEIVNHRGSDCVEYFFNHSTI